MTGITRVATCMVCWLAAGWAVAQDPLPQPRPAPQPAPQYNPQPGKGPVSPPIVPPAPASYDVSDGEISFIDLPTALRLVDSVNPAIAVARERIRQAYARLERARVIALPNVVLSPLVYNRHDGQFQTFTGPLITTNTQNIASNAGLVMQFATADAYFLPLSVRQDVRATAFASQATTNNTQRDVAFAYLDLLQAQGQVAINGETLANAEFMLKNAQSAIAAGKSSTGADAVRAETEVEARKLERIQLEANVDVRAARVAELLLLPPSVRLRPVEKAAIPITLVPPDTNVDDLVVTALANRPEVGQSVAERASVAELYRLEKARPFIPLVSMSYYGGGYGGGANARIADWNARSDGYVQLYWQFDNFGAGNAARIREARSVVRQADYRIRAVQASVSREVVQNVAITKSRLASLNAAQKSVVAAIDMWRRLSASSFGLVGGKYDPIQPLTAEQQLNQARLSYLQAVIDYNRSQFDLYNALGQPSLSALDQAAAVPTTMQTIPSGAGAVPVDPKK